MQSNSILNNLDKDTTISEIKLQLDADIEKKNVFIVVEGQNDITCLCKFFSDNVVLSESFSGKQGVEEIVSFFNNSRVIGIRDRDYKLEQESNKIFYYDFCCLEMMLINCDEVFKNLCIEYYDVKHSYLNFRLFLLSKLKKISLTRKFNEILFWGINFKIINPMGFWKKEKEDFDYNMLDKVFEKKSVYFNKTLIKYALLFNWTYWDYLNNTQGHDFFSLFSNFCTKKIKSENINASARVAFRFEDFKKTKLFLYLSHYSSFIGRNITL